VAAVHAEAAQYVEALATHSGECARAPFLFVGTPCLKHECNRDFTVPVMALFAFLAQPQLPVRAASFLRLPATSCAVDEPSTDKTLVRP